MTARSLAKRIQALEEEIALLDGQLDPLVKQSAPTLLTRMGIGTQHAAQLLITAGENIDRLRNEAAFARLCGVALIPVSSGYTHRMRLHRDGDRQANRALHMIAICRLRYDPQTINYMNRQRAEGLSKKDVLHCLKRFIAREVFNDLRTDLKLT
jgi:transposase